MTVDIDPIKCFINEGLLFNNDSVNYLPAKIIGITSYKYYHPTFQILIEDSYLFSDVSIDEICHDKAIKSKPNFQLSNAKCPSYEIDVFKHLYFKEREISFLDTYLKIYKKGTYCLSFDFYTDNEMLHLIKCYDGYFYFVPNHKINWNNKEFLPNFKVKSIINK